MPVVLHPLVLRISSPNPNPNQMPVGLKNVGLVSNPSIKSIPHRRDNFFSLEMNKDAYGLRLRRLPYLCVFLRRNLEEIVFFSLRYLKKKILIYTINYSRCGMFSRWRWSVPNARIFPAGV